MRWEYDSKTRRNLLIGSDGLVLGYIVRSQTNGKCSSYKFSSPVKYSLALENPPRNCVEVGKPTTDLVSAKINLELEIGTNATSSEK
jgi:hypothetical protein